MGPRHFLPPLSFRAPSRKTRIETRLYGGFLVDDDLSERHPEKQGLKLAKEGHICVGDLLFQSAIQKNKD